MSERLATCGCIVTFVTEIRDFQFKLNAYGNLKKVELPMKTYIGNLRVYLL